MRVAKNMVTGSLLRLVPLLLEAGECAVVPQEQPQNSCKPVGWYPRESCLQRSGQRRLQLLLLVLHLRCHAQRVTRGLCEVACRLRGRGLQLLLLMATQEISRKWQRCRRSCMAVCGCWGLCCAGCWRGLNLACLLLLAYSGISQYPRHDWNLCCCMAACGRCCWRLTHGLLDGPGVREV